MKHTTSVSLVLGGGGARGLAHIGVIRWLEENGYRIESISGCSVGALVGGIYGLGKLDEFVQWVTAISAVDIFRLLDISLGSSGLVKGDRIIETLRGLTGEALIEELPITYTAVASDILNEREVWLSRGPVFDAVRASIAIPLFFAPAQWRGLQLVDGAVLNPVPIAPCFRDRTDMTIAVNLGAKPDPNWPKLQPPAPPDEEESFFARKINQFINAYRPSRDNSRLDDMYDVASLALDTMEGAIARYKLAAYPPDVVIDIPRNLSTTLEFDRAKELIAAGYELASMQMQTHMPPQQGDNEVTDA
ncbi:MAG: patatin-like phospholipase family protein [Halioglobus sp.]|nr:patatin-like phospholipase family protein [Halioglobus sp.]